MRKTGFVTIEGSQDRNSSKAGTWGAGADAEAMKDAAYWIASACFLIEPRTTSPGMTPLTMGQTFLASITK